MALCQLLLIAGLSVCAFGEPDATKEKPVADKSPEETKLFAILDKANRSPNVPRARHFFCQASSSSIT